jgi:hypothetical protein
MPFMVGRTFSYSRIVETPSEKGLESGSTGGTSLAVADSSVNQRSAFIIEFRSNLQIGKFLLTLLVRAKPSLAPKRCEA